MVVKLVCLIYGKHATLVVIVACLCVRDFTVDVLLRLLAVVSKKQNDRSSLNLIRLGYNQERRIRLTLAKMLSMYN